MLKGSRKLPSIWLRASSTKMCIRDRNQGVSNIEITDPSIKEFEKIARKSGVDYAEMCIRDSYKIMLVTGHSEHGVHRLYKKAGYHSEGKTAYSQYLD